jgi:Arc/MetJ-type ribon-helix-helix transcriptional regulator
MPRVCVEVPKQILDDLMEHIGDDKKFVNLSDAVRTSCRRMLDAMDDIDRRHGRSRGVAK